MATHRALVLNSTSQPPSLETSPIPTATAGSIIVKVLGLSVLPYLSSILDGTLPYALTTPLVPGSSCIGRVHDVGPDALTLKKGDLVYCDITVRARDEPDKAFLMGLHGGAAMKLMEGEWRNGTFAEYAKFPMENCFVLDEEVLFRNMGVEVEDLCTISNFLVPFGGLTEIKIAPGDTVIVAPATGKFGGGAVTTALAMGASVVACGRNEKTLTAMAKIFSHTGRFTTLILTGDVPTDTAEIVSASRNGGKGADAFIDFSPASAVSSTHIAAALGALKIGGRAAFMGGIPGNIEIPYGLVMMKNLRIQGRFMYSRETIVKFIKMIEKGNLRLGGIGTGWETVGRFSFEGIEEAIKLAAEETGWGRQVVFIP
ncbi:isopropanol dehydrogenase [Tricladium varicosporioides]|nr:isopropanol dehydrogenase [Hymenoscyphus varicosporioides]